jgi:hypothetical protein
MEVLKVKVDFKKPGSGSIPENPTFKLDKHLRPCFEHIDRYAAVSAHNFSRVQVFI